MKKYRLTFCFQDTEEEARSFCALINEFNVTAYMKRAGYTAHYTPWTSADGQAKKFVCFYYES